MPKMNAQGWGASRELSSVVARSVTATLVGISLLGCGSAGRPQTVSLQDHQVASSSMAPFLLGPLHRARCTHCSRLLPVAAETVDQKLMTRCLDCGGQCAVDSQVIPGAVARVELRKQLSVDRPVVWLQSPAATTERATSTATSTGSSLDTFYLRRFERLVIRDPQSGQIQVKRLWGLPGERIEFRDGDLWINDQLYQKSIEELTEIAVPVAEYRAPSRLSAHSELELQNRYHRHSFFEPQGAWWLEPAAAFRWLYRRPARIWLDNTPPDQWLTGSFLVDDYSCNQGISRQLNPVSDWLLVLELSEPLRAETTGVALSLQIKHLDQVIAIDLLPPGLSSTTRSHGNTQPNNARANNAQANNARAEQVQAEPSPLEKPSVARHSIAGRHRLEVAYCDQRLLLRTDLETHELAARSSLSHASPALLSPAFVSPPLLSNNRPASGEEPFELELICQQRAAIRVESLALRRDLQLVAATSTAHVPTRWLVPGGALFVLGDNLPISIDSRSDLGFIQVEQVIGKIK